LTKMITGGTGYIGAEVARLLVERGEKPVLFDISPSRAAIAGFEDKVKVVRGDLGNYAEVLNVVRDDGVTEIFHLGSMLTNVSEQNPWGSFQTNVIGTYNILEAARLCAVKQVLFTSTLGTFGIGFGDIIDDETLQRPVTMYGCGKLYGEGLGRFYHKKFGLDFRSVRFAHMIGQNVRTPDHWAPPMIEDAVLGRDHQCIYANPRTSISMIHVRDAARAVEMVLAAPVEQIKTMNYNVTGVPRFVSARELESVLQKRFPAFRVTYQPVPSVQERDNMYGRVKQFDDSRARVEWGWQPLYGTPEGIIEAVAQDAHADSRARR
jgi:threonine 3-dehydrogenase